MSVKRPTAEEWSEGVEETIRRHASQPQLPALRLASVMLDTIVDNELAHDLAFLSVLGVLALVTDEPIDNSELYLRRLGAAFKYARYHQECLNSASEKPRTEAPFICVLSRDERLSMSRLYPIFTAVTPARRRLMFYLRYRLKTPIPRIAQFFGVDREIVDRQLFDARAQALPAALANRLVIEPRKVSSPEVPSNAPADENLSTLAPTGRAYTVPPGALPAEVGLMPKVAFHSPPDLSAAQGGSHD